MLRPLEEGEVATRPPASWVAVHESMFKHGFTLPLPGWVQYILCALRLAPGQIGSNAWRQLLGMYMLWHLSEHGWPTHNEVFACYKVLYSTKKGCSETVNLNAQAFGAIVEDLPTSATNWSFVWQAVNGRTRGLCRVVECYHIPSHSEPPTEVDNKGER